MRDLTNLKFGNLTVLSLNRSIPKKPKGYEYFWNCRCDCGKEVVVRTPNLYVKNKTKSCGCKRGTGIWRGVGEISGTYYAQLKCNARKRDIPFKITLAQIWDLFVSQKRLCALSGVELKFAHDFRRDEQTASLDRIDAAKGYELGNLIWVHKELNCLRLNMGVERFKWWCRAVTNHDNKIIVDIPPKTD